MNYRKINQGMTILLAAMMLLIAFPAGAFATPATEEGATVHQREAALAPQALADEKANMLDDAGYRAFGLSLQDPADFTATGDPLDGYEPLALSQLYVSSMNRSHAYQGVYAVYDTMAQRSEANATLTDAAQTISGNLDKNPVSGPFSYSPSSTGNEKYHAQNTIAVSAGPGRPDRLVDVILMTYEKGSGLNKKTYSALRLVLKEKDGAGQYVETARVQHDMADGGTKSKAAYDNIQAFSKTGLAALAAGDYDGDGADELAVYYPNLSTKHPPSVKIYDVANGSLSEQQSILLSELNHPEDPAQFNFTFKDWFTPIVHLATTSISGQDDLVINASLPFRTSDHYKDRRQEASLGIYRWDSATRKLVKTFADHLSYNISGTSSDRMRFVSAADADLTGNGIEELVLAGFRNSGNYGGPRVTSSNPIGSMEQDIYINMVLWEQNENTAGGNYAMALQQPISVKPTATYDFSNLNFSMQEPLSLVAAKLSEASGKDYIFARGGVFEFSAPGAATGKSEKELLRVGSFTLLHTINLKSWVGTHVSTAVAGYFAADHPGSEQIVVMTARSASPSSLENTPQTLSYDISWIWMENTTVVDKMTNHDYIDFHQSNNSGTSLVLCAVAANDRTPYYQYTGKQYGWSMPDVMAYMPAVPYYREIGYPGDPGTVSYTVGSSTATGFEADLSVGGGVTLGCSLTVGVGAAGNKVRVGGGLDAEGLLKYAGSYAQSKMKGLSYTVEKPADVDHVLVYAAPIVKYCYKMYVPTFTVTQEYIDRYRAQSKDGSCPYAVGQVVDAHFEDTYVYSQYDYVFSLLTLDEYNAACARYGASPLSETEQNELFPHAAGDASTYPSDFSQASSFNRRQSMTAGPIAVTIGGNTSFAFDKSKEISYSNGFAASFSTKVVAKVEGEIELIGSGGISGALGGVVAVDLGASAITTKVKSNSLSASIAYPNPGYEDYGFETSMGIWINKAAGGTSGAGVVPLVMGYTVKTEGNIPPKAPLNPYVYAAGTDSIALRWENPPATDSRKADGYEVYYRPADVSANFVLLGPASTDGEGFFLVTNLAPDTQYEFAFKSMKGGYTSPLSNGLRGATRKAGTLSITTQPHSQAVASMGETATLSVAANDTTPGREVGYQWQKLEQSGTGYGEWADIPGASGDSYLATIAEDGEKYRVRVMSYPTNPIGHSAPLETLYSLVATVTVGTTPRYDVAVTDVKKEGGATSLTPIEGAYYTQKGTELTLVAEVRDNTSALAPATGTDALRFEIAKDNVHLAEVPGTFDSATTTWTAIWTPAESGSYTIRAVYAKEGNFSIESTDSVQSGSAWESGEPAGEAGESAAPDDTTAPTDGTSGPPDAHPAEPKEETAPPDNGESTQPGAQSGGSLAQSAGSALPASGEEAAGTLSASAPSSTPPPGPSSEAPPLEEESPDAPEEALLGTAAENLAVSAPLRLHVDFVEDHTYRITYHTNGGQNDPRNPLLVSKSAVDARPLYAPGMNGAAFDGWFLESDFTTGISYIEPYSMTGDLSLYAKYTYQQYNINYKLYMDRTNLPITNPNLSAYTVSPPYALKDAVWPGATFLGWYSSNPYTADGSDNRDENARVYTLPTKAVGGDITLFAYWDIIDYNIDYVLNGNDDPGFAPATSYDVLDNAVDLTVTANIPSAPVVRPGHSFGGWYYDAGFTSRATSLPDAAHGVGDVTLYAKWVPRTLPVFFHSHGGSHVDPALVTAGDTLVRPGTPTRSGYDFDAWYTDAALATPYNFGNPVRGPMLLHANWIEDPDAVTVTYDSRGGTALGQEPASVGGLLDPPEDPRYLGYVFTGWYKEEACKNKWQFETGVVQGDMTLYAGWTEDMVTVTFDAKGGSSVQSQQVQRGQKAQQPKAPIRSGFTFDGWYRTEFAPKAWDFDRAIYGDMTLYARWTADPGTALTVTFDSQGGSVVPAQTVMAGGKVTKPMDPAKTGYLFGGWFRDREGLIPWDFDVDVVQDSITLYAHWKGISYYFEGGRNTYTGDKNPLIIVVDYEDTLFDSLLIDGGKPGAGSYAVEHGSTRVSLHPAYLRTLANGAHTFEGRYTDGMAASGVFYVQIGNPPSSSDPINPGASSGISGSGVQTGDDTNMAVWIALAAISAVAAMGAFLYGKKKSKKK